METGQNPKDRTRDDYLFTTLLGSAYSLQQYHDRIRSKVPAAKFSEIMSEVVNTQRLIRNRHLDSETAMHLVVNRTQKLVAAGGGAIVLLDGENLEYKVGTGLGAILLGLKIPAKSSIFFQRLAKEPIVETYAWEEDALRRRILSRILSVPIYRRARLAGCLQLFSRTGQFDAHGIHVCELMSAILSHSISDAAPEPEPIFVKAIVAENDEGVSLEHAVLPPPSGDSSKSQPRPDDAQHATKRIEDQGKKVLTFKAPNKASKPSPGLDLERQPIGSLVDQHTRSDSRQDDLEAVPNFEDLLREMQEEGGLQREATQGGRVHGSLLRSPFVAPPNGRLHLGCAELAEANASAQPEAPKSEVSVHSADELTVSDEQSSSTVSGDIHDTPESEVPKKTVWSRLKLLCYPVFVLVFAIVVGIEWGTHSWPLEILSYLLVVFTTLEIHHRLAKP